MTESYVVDEVFTLDVVEEPEGADSAPYMKQEPEKVPVGGTKVVKNFTCSMCGHLSSDMENYWEHVRTHEDLTRCDLGGRAFKCPQCDYSALVKQFLRSHIEENHSEGLQKRHRCSFCSFTTTAQKHLKSHNKMFHFNQVLCKD